MFSCPSPSWFSKTAPASPKRLGSRNASRLHWGISCHRSAWPIHWRRASGSRNGSMAPRGFCWAPHGNNSTCCTWLFIQLLRCWCHCHGQAEDVWKILNMGFFGSQKHSLFLLVWAICSHFYQTVSIGMGATAEYGFISKWGRKGSLDGEIMNHAISGFQLFGAHPA